MSKYIQNTSGAYVTLMGGSISLSPKGKEGSVKRLPAMAENHRDIAYLRDVQKVIRVLDKEQYKAYLLGLKKNPTAPLPSPSSREAPGEESIKEATQESPEEEPDEESVKEVVEESLEEVDLVDESEAQSSEDSDYLSSEEFQSLPMDEKRDYVRKIGLADSISLRSHDSLNTGYAQFLSE